MKLGVLGNVGLLVMTEIRHSILVRSMARLPRGDFSIGAREMICKILRENGNFIEIQYQLLEFLESFYAQIDGEIIP